MATASDDRATQRLQFVSRLGAYLVAAFACVALIGWFASIPALTSIQAGLASTSVATAVGFLLSALAIHILATPAHGQGGRDWVWRASAAIVVFIGVYALAGYAAGRADAGYLLGRNLGRVSPATATEFILLAAAVLCTDRGRGRIGAALIALGLIIAELDLVGYAYGIAALYRVLPFSAMALPTSLAFVVLFGALLLARPRQGWIQYAVRNDRVGMAHRLLLPAVVVIPFLLADVMARATTAGLFEPPFAFAILAVATTVVLGGLVIFVSAWMSHADAALRRAEEDLRQNAQLLEAAMGVAQLGAWISHIPPGDSAAGHIEWSAEVFGIFGLAKHEFDGRHASFLNMVHPDDRAALAAATRAAVERNVPMRVSYRIVRRDGTVRWIQQQARALREAGDGAATRLVGVLQDVTEARLVEQQLVQAQKMEAVGNLTGGMAHDFNNLLGVIIGNLDLLRPQVAGQSEAGELIGDALDAAMRGADLTRRLLAFARRQPLQPQAVAPNDLVAGIVKLLSRTLGESIEVALDLAPDVWPITVDPAQLEATIANLATNARDAMPKGGSLTIATANRQLDADYASAHAEVEPGDYVMIEVSDNGSGMTPEIAARVFEPFFTTKDLGKGTGLGLSMVFGFIKQSGGHVNVYSEPGVGTTFRLYLPRADKLQAAAADKAEAAPRAAGGNETVLVVEDNVAMRRIVVRQLTELGYRVVEADSGATARDILERETVDVLLTDIVMPGELDGIALAQLAVLRHPSLKIVLTSGFPENKFNGRGDATAGMRLLSKPYRRDDLARTLREVLNA
jgi:PAS domain S-box-containing protein